MFTSTIWFRFDLFHFSVFLRFWALFSFCWLPCSTSRLPSLLRAAVRAQMWEGERPETCQSKTSPLRSFPTRMPNYDLSLQIHRHLSSKCVCTRLCACVCIRSTPSLFTVPLPAGCTSFPTCICYMFPYTESTDQDMRTKSIYVTINDQRWNQSIYAT